MPRFFNNDGSPTLGTRRSKSNYVSLPADADIDRIVDEFNKLSKRVSELEAKQPPDYVEFVVRFNNSTHHLQHNFNGSVRWWVSSTSAIATITKSSLSTANTLILSATGSFRAIIRVEPSQFPE